MKDYNDFDTIENCDSPDGNLTESELIADAFMNYYAEQAISFSDSIFYESMYEDAAILSALFLEGVMEEVTGKKSLEISKNNYEDAKKKWKDVRHVKHLNHDELTPEQLRLRNNSTLFHTANALDRAEKDYRKTEKQYNSERAIAYKRAKEAARLKKKADKSFMNSIVKSRDKRNETGSILRNPVEEACELIEASMITFESDCEELIKEGVINEEVYENSIYLLTGFMCNEFVGLPKYPDWYMNEKEAENFLENVLPEAFKLYSSSFLLEFKRSELPDEAFGVPEERKFPLVDKKHVESAIKLFHRVDPKYEEELANNIIKKMKEFDMIGNCKIRNKKFEKYLKEKEQTLSESFDLKGFPAVREFNVGAMLPTIGLTGDDAILTKNMIDNGYDLTPERSKRVRADLILSSKRKVDDAMTESSITTNDVTKIESDTLKQMKDELDEFEKNHKDLIPFKRLNKKKVTPTSEEKMTEIGDEEYKSCFDYCLPKTNTMVLRLYTFKPLGGVDRYSIIRAESNAEIDDGVMDYYVNAFYYNSIKSSDKANMSTCLTDIIGEPVKESEGFVTEGKTLKLIKADAGYKKALIAFERDNPKVTKLSEMKKKYVMTNGKIYDKINNSYADRVRNMITKSGIKNIDQAWVYEYKNGKPFALCILAAPKNKEITRIYFMDAVSGDLKKYYQASYYYKTDCVPLDVLKWVENYKAKVKAVKESVEAALVEATMDFMYQDLIMNDIRFDGVLNLFEIIHPNTIRYSSLVRSPMPLSDLKDYEDIIGENKINNAISAEKFTYGDTVYIIGVNFKDKEEVFFIVNDKLSKDEKMYYLAAMYNNKQGVPRQLIQWRAEFTTGTQSITENSDIYELFEEGNLLSEIHIPSKGNFMDFVDYCTLENIDDIDSSAVLYDAIDYCESESIDRASELFVKSINSKLCDFITESTTTTSVDKKKCVYTTKLSDNAFNLTELTNKIEELGFEVVDKDDSVIIYELQKENRLYRLYLDSYNKKISIVYDEVNKNIFIDEDGKITPLAKESSYDILENDKRYFYESVSRNDAIFSITTESFNHLSEEQQGYLNENFKKIENTDMLVEKAISNKKMISDTTKIVHKIDVKDNDYNKAYFELVDYLNKLENSGEKSIGKKNPIKISVVRADAKSLYESINNTLGDFDLPKYKRILEAQLKKNKRSADVKTTTVSVKNFNHVLKNCRKINSYLKKAKSYSDYLDSIKVKEVKECTDNKIYDLLFEYKDDYGIKYESYDSYRMEEAYSAYIENVRIFEEAEKEEKKSIGSKISSGVKSVGNATASAVKTTGKAASNAVKTTGKIAVNTAKATGKVAIDATKAAAKLPLKGAKAIAQYIKDGNTMLYFIVGEDEDGNEVVGKCTVAEYKRLNETTKQRIDSYEIIDKYRYNKIKEDNKKHLKDKKRITSHTKKLDKLTNSKHDVRVAYESKIDTSDVDLKYEEKDRSRLVSNIEKIGITKIIEDGKKLIKTYTDLRSKGVKNKDVSILKVKRNIKKIEKKIGKSPMVFTNIMKTNMPIKELGKFEKLVVSTNQLIDESNKKIHYSKIVHKKDLENVSTDKTVVENVEIINKFMEDYGVDIDYITEGKKDIDGDMKPLLQKLHAKGYKTTSSCSGHVNTRIKEDGYRDGVYNGKIYTTARIVFGDKYDLPNAPSLWETRDAHGKTAIYVKHKSISDSDGGPDRAFDKWKVLYMNSLKKWIDRLPENKK